MMEHSYNLFLVALSYLIAVAASYVALQLSRRVAETSGKTSRLWLSAGACSMGIGIWTMHFVGMLALRMPMQYGYDVTLTFISLLVGILAAAFAIATAARDENSVARLLCSGLILGCGIAGMHYTGMAAMIMQADTLYDPEGVGLSVLIAVVGASAAIWIIFTLVHSADKQLSLLKLGAALVMGLAICGMHYSGMAAVTYVPWPDAWGLHIESDNTWMAVVTGGVALLILGATQFTVLMDNRLSIEKSQGRQSERKAVQFSEMLDDSLNEIYVFDSDSLRIVKANRGAVSNLGYTTEELVTMSPVDIMPNLTRDDLVAFIAPLLDGSLKGRNIQATFKRKDGSEYQVQVHLHASALTSPPAIVAFANDITQKVQLESELAQARKMESIGQLAAGIAHEINTPIQFVGDNTRFVQGAVNDLLQLLERYHRLHTAARSGEACDTCLNEIEEAVAATDLEFLREEMPMAIEQSLEGVSRVSNIVRAMKEFSHPGSRDRESIDLNEAIRNTITVATNEWKYVAEMETDFDPHLPAVPCYVQEINQVILNLIVNAAHAIEAGNNGEHSGPGTIRITTSFDQKYVQIALSDSGCGIPADIRDRIFDPFFTTKEVGKGSGQGLAMVYRTIIESHNGQLEVDSEVATGTTFYVRLPLEIAANTADAKEPVA